MFTQACHWGWRDSNPAQWAEPPALSNVTPVVATPAEIKALLDAAEESRRPSEPIRSAQVFKDKRVVADHVEQRGFRRWSEVTIKQVARLGDDKRRRHERPRSPSIVATETDTYDPVKQGLHGP